MYGDKTKILSRHTDKLSLKCQIKIENLPKSMQIRQYLIKLNQCITPFTKIKMSWFCTGKTNEELVNNLRGMPLIMSFLKM